MSTDKPDPLFDDLVSMRPGLASMRPGTQEQVELILSRDRPMGKAASLAAAQASPITMAHRAGMTAIAPSLTNIMADAQRELDAIASGKPRPAEFVPGVHREESWNPGDAAARNAELEKQYAKRKGRKR